MLLGTSLTLTAADRHRKLMSAQGQSRRFRDARGMSAQPQTPVDLIALAGVRNAPDLAVWSKKLTVVRSMQLRR
jgi:hypothetical protein